LVAWNAHNIIPGWCENFLMGISSVNNLLIHCLFSAVLMLASQVFFNGQIACPVLTGEYAMVKFIIILGWSRQNSDEMAISYFY
jgi:hypothetical protein